MFDVSMFHSLSDEQYLKLPGEFYIWRLYNMFLMFSRV